MDHFYSSCNLLNSKIRKKSIKPNCLYRLASKTTDVNWRKEKDTAELHKYYENRQFKWFNPRGVDYSTLSDKRGAPDYKN